MKALRVKTHSGSGRGAGAILILLGILSLFAASSTAQKKQKLEKSYREWLEHDVPYIITKEERDEFLKLPSDAARDKFISDFWEVRNPEPGAPTNAYKEELYRRIAFANARFGVGSGEEGWRTDRGRTYITLGEPQQKEVHRNSANLYPIEIWFYGGGSASLPRAFYVLFYQRDGSGDYRFYSPYLDGPDKLVTGVEAVNSPGAALNLISNSVGSEVARISLSLLVDEPVDMRNPQPSLESDILLQKIKGFANLPENRADILRRRTQRESVSARMVLQGRNLDILTLPVRDALGQTRLDYAIRLHSASDLALAADDNGRYKYSVEVRIRVFGPQNRLLFTQQKSVSDSLDRKKFEAIKDRPFGYQGTLPLTPGKYRLDIQFTDWTKKLSFQTEREVTVPEPKSKGFIIPGVLLFSNAEVVDDPFLRNYAPFTMGGVRFSPVGGAPPVISLETPVQATYQIWGPQIDPRNYAGKSLAVQYSVGRPAAPGSIQTMKDDVNLEQFSESGSLVNGKKLALSDKSPGNYILTLSVLEPQTNQVAYSTVSFSARGEGAPQLPWEVDQPEIGKDVETGLLEQERGICLVAQGHPDEGRRWLLAALRANRENDPAREELVEQYFLRHDFRAVAALYADAGVTDHTDSRTITRIASSLQATGELPKAVSLLESSVDRPPQDGSVYLALADLYKRQGETDKAIQAERKGRAMSGSKL